MTHPRQPEPATGRSLHRVSIILGAIVLIVAIPLASALGPVVGLLGYLIVLSALTGIVLAVVGRKKTPQRYGRAAFALTVIPLCMTALLLMWIVLMVLALGGGNPNS